MIKYFLFLLIFSIDGVAMHIFKMLDFRVGKVDEAVANTRARYPSLKIKLDFGNGFSDLTQSSAQLRSVYDEGEPLREMQILAVTNFPEKKVGIPSFFLTLGVLPNEGENLGTVVLKPLKEVPNGAKAMLSHEKKSSLDQPRLKKVSPDETFHILNIRVGTVVDLNNKIIDFGYLGFFSYKDNYEEFHENLQVLRLFDETDNDNFIGFFLQDNGRFIPIIVERPVQNGRILK